MSSDIKPPIWQEMGVQSAPMPRSISLNHDPNAPTVKGGPSGPNMHEILGRLNGATNNAFTNLKKMGQTNPQVNEMLHTSHYGDENSGSVDIDRYEVRYKTDESGPKPKKIFSVFDKENKHIIAEDLLIYESAYGIVKLLNRGASTGDPQVVKFIQLEESYWSKRQEAADCKRKYNKAVRLSEYEAADIIHAKYQQARERALSVKQNVKQLCESVGKSNMPSPLSPRRQINENYSNTYSNDYGTNPYQAAPHQGGQVVMQFDPFAADKGSYSSHPSTPNDYANVNLQEAEAQTNQVLERMQKGDFDY